MTLAKENDLEAPVLSYEDIRKRADAFLHEKHSERSIPVPIEEIVEFQFGINIVPLPGLHKGFEIDGFTSSDMKSIFVDESFYGNIPKRYRFTLAHEIGHIVLHKNLYRKNNFKDIVEWKKFINSIPIQTHRWLEYQAYAFGGLVLVPSEHLQRLSDKYVKRIRKEGISLEDNWDFCWEYIAAQLAKDFDVSSQVIDKRLEKDGIKERYQTHKK